MANPHLTRNEGPGGARGGMSLKNATNVHWIFCPVPTTCPNTASVNFVTGKRAY